MRKVFMICFCIIAASLFFAGLSFAQGNAEQLTITTYYPSPYGVYKELRLYPSSQPGCNGGSDKGKMYYDNSEDKIFFCNGSKWNAYAAPTEYSEEFTADTRNVVDPPAPGQCKSPPCTITTDLGENWDFCSLEMLETYRHDDTGTVGQDHVYCRILKDAGGWKLTAFYQTPDANVVVKDKYTICKARCLNFK